MKIFVKISIIIVSGDCMKKMYKKFLNKTINVNELLLMLNKLSKYSCFKDLNILISDINNIINFKYGKAEYEDINEKLGIKNYYNENEIMQFMNNIRYGWLDKNNIKSNLISEFFSDYYILQSPKQVAKNKIGVCWDQVELERYYFYNTELKIKTYFICHYDDNKCPTHTFLVYEKDNKYYWFEHSWEIYRGIHKYNNIKELLIDVRSKFIISELNDNYEKNNLMLYEYDKPEYGISVLDFYKHCENGNIINLEDS